MDVPIDDFTSCAGVLIERSGEDFSLAEKLGVVAVD